VTTYCAISTTPDPFVLVEITAENVDLYPGATIGQTVKRYLAHRYEYAYTTIKTRHSKPHYPGQGKRQR